MKNQKEIYEALLAGETLIHTDGDIIKLNSEGSLVDAESGDTICWTLTPRFLSIYVKPKWYENIPNGGVLCWYYQEDEKYMRIITEHIRYGTSHAFITNYGGSIPNATPLTKEEIQIFMDNAPGEV